jgi:hypothetical protein
MRRIATALGLLLAAALPSEASAAPEYFPFPTGYGASNFGVAVDDQGNVWFGASGPPHTNPTTLGSQPTPSLARLVPAQAHAGTSDGIAFYPTPDDLNVNCCANQLRSLAYNKFEHKLYWVRSDGHLGSGDPTIFVAGGSTGMSTYRLPGNQDLWDVAAVPNGPGVWLTEKSASNVSPTFYGSRIAFSAGGGAPTEGPNIAVQNGNTTLNSLRYDAKPSGIEVDAAGKPWFVEEDPGNAGYRIGTYAGSGSSYQEFSIDPCEAVSPCSGSYTGTGLSDLAIAPDGGIWFTNVLNHKFGRFDPGTHQMVQYTMGSVGLAGGDPRQMTAAPDGTIWMTSYQFNGGSSSALVQIVPPADPAQAPVANVYKTPGTTALGLGADGSDLWFSTIGQGSTGTVGRLAGVIGTPPPDDGGGDGGGDDGGGDDGGGTPTTPTVTVQVTPPAKAPATPAGPPIVLKPATTGTARVEPPQTGNGAINTNQICVGPPESRCSVVYLVREHEYVAGFPSAVGKAKKKPKRKPRTLATKAVTLKGGETRKITIKLNRLGQRILKGKHSVKVDFIVSQKVDGGKTRVLSRKTLTVKLGKAKKKR